ncbi:MAG: RNA-binding S4 domain-containing protein [Candidatus Omnitrophica bacterium]|nr:RNA-binding S4 domain-containing protein [Candidatus Omnitrophota bacterium]
MDFKLKSEFIELDNLLKVTELVSSGAEAKQYIQSGQVKVNAQAENRIRRKLRAGDIVEFRQQQISVIK